MEKKKMTDLELYNLINSIEPMNERQSKFIGKVLKELFILMNKPYDQTITEFVDYYDSFEGKECARVYKVYEEFCEERNYKPLNNKAFGRALCDMCSLESKAQRMEDNKIMRVYKFKELY